MASKAQRAVTGVPAERWGQLGRALQAWREDVLGYKARSRFAADRLPLTPDGNVNTKLIQELEMNYRPGTFTRWSLEDAAGAYRVTYESVLAFLHGEADTLVPVPAVPAAAGPAAPAGVPALPPSPLGDPGREAADRPYALAIWDRFLSLPRRVGDPSGAELFPGSPADARDWDKYTADWDIGDRVWFVADLQRRQADSRNGAGATG